MSAVRREGLVSSPESRFSGCTSEKWCLSGHFPRLERSAVTCSRLHYLHQSALKTERDGLGFQNEESSEAGRDSH